VSRGSSGWIITSSGTFGPPISLNIRRFELKYTDDWQPLELKIEATLRNAAIALATSFSMTTAINEVSQNGTTNSKEDQITARTVVLPNNFYASYEALAVHLAASQVDAEIPVYVAPQGEIKVKVRAITAQTLTGPSGTLEIRRFDLTFNNPGTPLEGSVSIDNRARFVRLELPSTGLTVVRDDASSVAMRATIARNPTDVDVSVPANGFNLAGTLTTPPTVAARLRSPGIVLVGGSGPTDRDETVVGIPIFTQLAKALADNGFIVLRYDKRGVGQSGGRTDTATLSDYADDVVAAVRWLSRRNDVDERKIIVCGHSEGGAVALIAAGREKKIDGVIAIAAPGGTGADLILEQQRHLLDVMKASDADKQAKIELQKKIQAAVISGTGWEDIPPEVRKQADVPWFRSLLAFDPAEALGRTKQPLLIVQGDLDTQVAPENADKLAELARARKKAGPVEAVHIPGINHLLVPATTGEVSEYGALKGTTISPKVSESIVDWVKKSF
jgi:alpha-beta hydrolase superfamily lysophospholipase